jgi:hypothetical protein
MSLVVRATSSDYGKPPMSRYLARAGRLLNVAASSSVRTESGRACGPPADEALRIIPGNLSSMSLAPGARFGAIAGVQCR